MTLFESPSQYREKATIWRIFQLLPLYGSLAEGHVFRWFAVNIPMDLLTGGKFTSDIDVIACLLPIPRRGIRRDPNELIFKTWEVKVSLLTDNGMARSLKAGKTRSTLKQLNAYRDFGSPEVSLLDTYICAPGFFANNSFPPTTIHSVINERLAELKKHSFGYQLLPFEHGKDGDVDVGLLSMRPSNAKLLPAAKTRSSDPFLRFVNHLDGFFKSAVKRQARKAFIWIVFCRRCRRLGLIGSKEEYVCTLCGADLVVQ
jgi:hypothetical protein